MKAIGRTLEVGGLLGDLLGLRLLSDRLGGGSDPVLLLSCTDLFVMISISRKVKHMPR